MTTYRVGNHQPQNVYRGEEYIGVMFTAEDAALVVEALNEHERLAELRRDVTEHLMPPQPVGPTSTCEGCNRARRTGSWNCPRHGGGHRAEQPGPDGLGYGACVACRGVWPCQTVRARLNPGEAQP